jgi:hypothetical protein
MQTEMNRTQWEVHYFTDLGSHVNPLERFGKIALELNRTPLKDLPPQDDINAEDDGLIEAYRTVTNRKPIPKHLELLGNYCLSHYLKSQNSNKKDEASPILSHHQNERTYKQEVIQFNDELHSPTKNKTYFQRNPDVLNVLEQAEDIESPIVLIGSTLKTIQKSCKVTQADLSEAICVSKNYLSAMERGVKPITAKQNAKLVDFFTNNQEISIKVLQFAIQNYQTQGEITA